MQGATLKRFLSFLLVLGLLSATPVVLYSAEELDGEIDAMTDEAASEAMDGADEDAELNDVEADAKELVREQIQEQAKDLNLTQEETAAAQAKAEEEVVAKVRQKFEAREDAAGQLHNDGPNNLGNEGDDDPAAGTPPPEPATPAEDENAAAEVAQNAPENTADENAEANVNEAAGAGEEGLEGEHGGKKTIKNAARRAADAHKALNEVRQDAGKLAGGKNFGRGKGWVDDSEASLEKGMQKLSVDSEAELGDAKAKLNTEQGTLDNMPHGDDATEEENDAYTTQKQKVQDAQDAVDAAQAKVDKVNQLNDKLGKARIELRGAKEDFESAEQSERWRDDARQTVKANRDMQRAARGRIRAANDRISETSEKYGLNTDGSMEDRFGTDDEGTYRKELEDQGLSDDEIEQKVKEFNDAKDELAKKTNVSDPMTDEDIENVIKAHANDEGFDAEEARQDLKKMQEDQENRIKDQDEIDGLERENRELNKELSPAKRAWDDVKAFASWLKDQMGMAMAFMIPSDIVRWIQAEEAIKALYETITQMQSFAGINMQPVKGMIPRHNPTGGEFLYSDQPILDNYTSTNQRFFSSYTKYDGIAKSYLGEGVIQMLNYNTGAILDGSGVITQTLPLFGGTKNTQNYVASQARAIDGLVHKVTSGSSLFTLGHYTHGPEGNSYVASLFYPKKGTSYNPPTTSEISPLIQKSSLDVFKNTVTLTGFENISIAGLEGIGAMTYPLVHYADLFVTPTGKAAGAGPSLLNAIEHASGSVDVTTTSGLTKALTGGYSVTGTPTSPTATITSLGISSITSQGVVPGVQLIGQGMYVYQSETTPTAKYMRSTVPAPLQKYVYDYLVCLNDAQAVVPALVPRVYSSGQAAQLKVPVVKWVQNPNIQYVSSIVSGLTWATGGGATPMKKVTSNGVIENDYSIATAAVKGVGSYTNVHLKTQLGAMKFLAHTLISAGPFTLRSKTPTTSYVATRVTGLENEFATTAAAGDTARIDGELGGSGPAATPGTGQIASLTLPQKRALLQEGGGIYIYEIANQLPSGADGKTLLSDYVVPVNYNSATGNYVMVSLGANASNASGAALPSVFGQVLALVSLITGEMYTAEYTLHPGTAPMYAYAAPGVPSECPKTQLAGVVCDQATDNQLQQGITDAPLATKFMATDLNPLNKGKSGNALVKMWPMYFTLIPYDYCPSGITASVTATQDIAGYFSAGFATVNACAAVKTLPHGLDKILPKKFSNKLNDIHSQWTDYMVNNNKWSLTLSKGPHRFTQNGAYDWTISGEQTAILDGFYLYTANSPHKALPLAGLWVAAQLGSNVGTIPVSKAGTIPGGFTVDTGTQYMSIGEEFGLVNENEGQTGPPSFAILQPPSTFSLDSFTSFGGDFTNKPGLNALINIATGSVFIKVSKSINGNSTEVLLPVANAAGGLYQFKPSTVSDKLKTAAKVANFSPTLEMQINQMQSGRNTDIFGPYTFGPFTCFINRQQVNDGNYIYQAFKGDLTKNPKVYDYLVQNNGVSWGGPINLNTQKMVSLVSGIKYESSGLVDMRQVVNKKGQYVVYVSVDSKSGLISLQDFPSKIFQILSSISGTPVSSKIAAAAKALNVKYVREFQAKKQTKEGTTGMDYAEEVIHWLSTGQIKSYSFPAESDLTKVPGISTGLNNLDLYTDSNNNYYVKGIPLGASKTGGYYAFNIAKPNDKLLTQVPTGVYFEYSKGKVYPQNVIYGQAAISMASAHGVSISSVTGKQSKMFPVHRKALPMGPSDKNLAGGKKGSSGSVMKLLQTTPAITTPSGNKMYLYSNVANFNGQTRAQTTVSNGQLVRKQVPTEGAPFDILLQSNPPGGQSYYISLITGTEYTITGQPKGLTAKAYLAQGANKKLMLNAPLISWGKGDQFSLFVPTTGVNVLSRNLRYSGYTMDGSGVIYQYTEPTGSTKYNFTYVNPATNKRDGGAYQVATTATKTAVKSWTTTVNGELPMVQALKYAAKSGLRASMNIYYMTNGGVTDNNGPEFITANYNVTLDQYSIYNTSGTTVTPIGTFQKAVNNNGSPMLIPSVLSLLGQRAKGSSLGQPLTAVTQDKYQRAISLRNNIPSSKKYGEVIGICFDGLYYKLDPLKHNWFDSGTTKHISAVEAVSPLLYCKGGSDTSASTGGACKDWPTHSAGAQLPNDVNFYSIQTSTGQFGGSAGEDYVYGFAYPAVDQTELNKYYTQMGQRPVSSNLGIFTMVSDVDVSSLKSLDTSYIHSTSNVGDTWTSYQTSQLSSLTSFYNNKAQAIQTNAANTGRAVMANAAHQPKSPKDKGPSIAEREAHGYAEELHWKSENESFKTTAEGKAQEQKLIELFKVIEERIKNLYYDTTTGYVLYKVVPADALPTVSSGYVSYPNKDGLAGGFVFDTNGKPTGAVVSTDNMKAIQKQMGQLRIVQANPLVLSLPKIVGITVNVPSFVPLSQLAVNVKPEQGTPILGDGSDSLGLGSLGLGGGTNPFGSGGGGGLGLGGSGGGGGLGLGGSGGGGLGLGGSGSDPFGSGLGGASPSTTPTTTTSTTKGTGSKTGTSTTGGGLGLAGTTPSGSSTTSGKTKPSKSGGTGSLGLGGSSSTTTGTTPTTTGGGSLGLGGTTSTSATGSTTGTGSLGLSN